MEFYAKQEINYAFNLRNSGYYGVLAKIYFDIPELDDAVGFDYSEYEFNLSGKRDYEDWGPYEFDPLQPCVVWKGETSRSWNDCNTPLIPGKNFITDSTALSKNNYLKIYAETTEWDSIHVISATWKYPMSQHLWNDWDKRYDDYTTIDCWALTSLEDHSGIFILPLKNESDELIADIINNGLTLWTNFGNATITKVEVGVGDGSDLLPELTPNIFFVE